MILHWTPDLAVGHADIDAQHQEIFAHYHAFLQGCDQGRSAERLRDLFAYLNRYVAEHFAAEEALMEETGYPAAADHRAEHRYFRQRLLELSRELDHSGPNVQVLVRTNKTLVRWLADHIRKQDRRLNAYLNGAAEKP